MSKEALKLSLDDLMTEYYMERTSFAKRVDEIFKQALAAPVHFAWMRYEADCAGDPVLVLARSTEEGAFKVYKEPPAAKPAQEQYAALEQALTRLQKRYGELESRLAANPTTEKSSAAQPAPVQPVAREELTNSQIMASVGRCSAGISESRPLRQQWDQVCDLIRYVMRERGYTTPPAAQRPWVGLTDEKLVKLCDEFWLYPRKLLQAIEAELKEKNTAQPAVPMTNDEVDRAIDQINQNAINWTQELFKFARAIEAAHGIKENA